MIERIISLKGAAVLSVYTCKHLMYSIPEECVQVMVGPVRLVRPWLDLVCNYEQLLLL